MEFAEPPTIPDVPARCLRCPNLEGRLAFQEVIRDDISANSATLAEHDEFALGITEKIYNIVSVPQDLYDEMHHDLQKVVGVTELFPATLTMSLGEFLDTYRTDENELGDRIFAPFIGEQNEVLEVSAIA